MTSSKPSLQLDDDITAGATALRRPFQVSAKITYPGVMSAKLPPRVRTPGRIDEALAERASARKTRPRT